MNDNRLEDLLRTALPPVDSHVHGRDLWPELNERLDRPPRWSLVDLSLAAAIVVWFALFPESLWLLAYHM